MTYVVASPLPDLSSSTSRILTAEQQNQLGESLYLELKRGNQLNSDPVVNSYIDGLGQRLLSAAPYSPNSFLFFVVDSPQINAFATFGGYVGIYSGLILAAQDESELASVIAHEISHVTQDHLRRTIEKSNQLGVPVTVALLAAILLGQNAPQVAEAAAAAVLAGQQQQQLSYTRSHEQEADRLGIERLSQAKFDPQAMARFFSLIQDRSRYSSVSPEFLRTHPVTTQRISEAQDRARQLPPRNDPSSIEFVAVQARLKVSESSDVEQLIRDLTAQDDTKSRYALALALHKNQRYGDALAIIKELKRQFPDTLPFQLSEARILEAMGEFEKAALIYQNIINISPRNRPATTALTELYISQKNYTKAEELLLKLGQQSPLQPQDYRLLAKIVDALDKKAESYLYLAEALILENDYKLALEELRRAQQYATDSFYINNRLDARIDELQEKTRDQNGPK